MVPGLAILPPAEVKGSKSAALMADLGIEAARLVRFGKVIVEIDMRNSVAVAWTILETKPHKTLADLK
jgi:hypothetical protein